MQSPFKHSNRALTVPAKVALAYATFGSLWILLSDHALGLVFRDSAHLTLMNILKGWFFVAMTTVLLYGLVRRLVRRPAPLIEEGIAAHHAWWWRALMYVFAAAAVAAALAIRSSIMVPFGERPFISLFLFPVILSAFLGGIGPGLVATAAIGVAVGYAGILPLPGAMKPIDVLQWGFLFADGLLVSVLSEVFHRSRRQIEANRELQVVTLESIGDAVITTDTQGCVTFLNPVAEKLTGWDTHAALGCSLSTVFPVINEETRRPVRDPVQEVLATGAIVGLANHTLLLARDGREIPIHDSAAPIRSSSGEVLGVVLVFRDDSERRSLAKAQQERLDALRLLGAIADSSSDVIFAKDLEGRYLLFNREAVRVTGKAAEEVLGRDDTVLFPPEEARVLMDLSCRVVREGRPVTTEETLTTTEGLRVFLAAREPLRDQDGRIVGLFGISRDITERKHFEEALRESEADLEHAQAIAHVGSWRLDIAAGDLAWSKEACRIFGVPPGEGRTLDGFFALVHPDDQDRVLEVWRGALDGEPYDVEHRIQAGDGIRWVRERGEVRRDAEGRPDLAFGTVQDITERKRAETEKARLQADFLQAQKMESIGRLAGGVAHDFNNMLQVIAGNAELALAHVDPSTPLHGEIRLIKRAAERSAGLTRQLLAFARRQAISPKVLDLNDAVANMLKMLGRLVGEDIKLVWVPRADLWKARIDPAQLDQVLANLTVNARDAIATVGTITLETGNETLTEADCEGVLGARPGEYVTLSVRDTGCGMEPDLMEHIFEPFFTTKSGGKGTGLGLATVFGIAQQNGGFVRVSSRVGSGSLFRVSFPRHVEEDAGADRDPEAHPPRGRGERILLVEDEEALLSVGEAMLKELGYAVVPVGSPEDALREVQASGESFGLFLVDVVMPGMNGRDLALHLSALRPGVPVLFMSGYTADVIADRGTLVDGLHLIEKPFTMLDLSRKVREVLG